jgi:hypothetical protein
MVPGVQLTDDEFADIQSLMGTFDILGRMFREEGGTPVALRMVVGSCRRAADTLEVVANRWEANQ